MKKILLILAIFLTSCTVKQPTLEKYTNLTINGGFNTVIELTGYMDSRETFDTYFNEMVKDFIYLNQLFDIYYNYEGLNNLKTINDNAGIEPVVVDPIIIDMLLMASNFNDLSSGEFDVSFGAVLKIWHTYREDAINNLGGTGPVPSFSELEAMQDFTGFDKVVIDQDKQTVYLTEKNVRLDVGGIAKGYATEYVAKKFEAKGFIGIINAGGNTRMLGTKPDGKPWGIGIRSPSGDGTLLALSISTPTSSVTSGDYERFFQDSEGNKYHHIIDPKTLFPANNFRSVTIVTKDSGMADAMSTTLYTLSIEEGLKVIENFKEEFSADIEVVWVTDKAHEVTAKNKLTIGDYNIVYTDGLIDKISY